jgi:two-component system phosphate regulon sensor histidine kinase PhoR
MMDLFKWRTALWLVFSTVLIPAVLTISVGILILVFYRESWDVTFGVLVLCFAVFAVVGSSITVFLLRSQGRLTQMQSEFIANMSHEFRTPLTSIRMFVDTLRSGRVKSTEEEARCLDLLAQETERMERMVDRVLTFRQLEKADSGLRLAPQELPALVQRALAPWSEVDEAAAERLELVMEPDLPRVMVDPDPIVEATRNLVANALKYTRGTVVITLRHDGEGIAVSVRDQGPAIPRWERKRIFKRFYRGRGTREQGSGLGLAIAKGVAEAHGGRLDLKSSEGVGNVFTLLLPLVERRAPARVQPVTVTPGEDA